MAATNGAPAANGQAYTIIDHTYDVVVVGAGGAGLRATLGAAQVFDAAGNTSDIIQIQLFLGDGDACDPAQMGLDAQFSDHSSGFDRVGVAQ